MRQITRSEAATERELQRSESLLVDVQDKSRQLETASTYKSHFLASASHDLRQPLHALNLFVAQLQNEASPAERSRLVGRIDAAVGSMNELFEALLDMTKLEAGILRTNVTEFPIARLLERIETTFADVARKKGLNLHVVRSSAWVSSDPILLERILLNLVSNAVRYTERGGVVVGCRRRSEELRIDVCDTGAGIPEEQRQRIFGEFYQMAGTAQDRSGGLGLDEPDIDLAAMARAQGAEGIGPITQLSELHAAVKKAIDHVKAGKVCVVDVRVVPGYDTNMSGAASPARR
jgi:signal transduction histidine kinase